MSETFNPDPKKSKENFARSFELALDISKTFITVSSIFITALLATPRILLDKSEITIFHLLPTVPFLLIIFSCLYLLFKGIEASRLGDLDIENSHIRKPLIFSIFLMGIGLTFSIVFVLMLKS